MNDFQDDIFKEFNRFFSERNFEKSRRFHDLHSYDPGKLKSFLTYLGNPQGSYKTVHIAGTTGKGSTATFLTRALTAESKTGLFVSPHYENLNERITVNEIPISEAEFSEIWRDICRHPMAQEISYFDALTAMAMIYFKIKNVGWAVFETGLGGRYDSTNNLQPEFCIITEIGLDHQKILGPDIKAISFEKAGIIKTGVPVYANVSDKSAGSVLSEVCRTVDTSLYFYPDNHEGDYLKRNSKFVQWVYESFFEKTMPPVSIKLRGRLEELNARPLLIFDSAHNNISFDELTGWINHYPGEEWNIYLNLMKERSLEEAVRIFTERSTRKINLFLFPVEDNGYYQEPDVPEKAVIRVIQPQEFKELLSDTRVNHLVTGSIRLYALIKKVVSELNWPSSQHSTAC